MKIKKVDGKPIIIHIREKPKLHTKLSSQKKIKGRNVLSISRGPIFNGYQMKQGYNRKKINQVTPKVQQKEAKEAADKKKSDKDTTKKKENLFQNEQKKAKIKERSAKEKRAGAIKAVGVAGTKTTLNELEGGNQVYESAQIMSVLASPLNSASAAGRKLYRSKATKHETEKRIKK